MPRGTTASALKTAMDKAAAKTAAKTTADVVGGEVEEIDSGPIVFTPRTLGDYDGQLYVRNETATFVSFDGGKKVGTLQLRQAGTDGSVAPLSPKIARHPGFVRFWRAGKVTVTNDPEMEDVLDKYSTDGVELERIEQLQTGMKVFNPRTQELEFPNLGDLSEFGAKQ